MQKLQQAVAPRGAKAGCEIRNRPVRQIAGQAIQQRIAEPPGRRRLRRHRSRANHQLELIQQADQPQCIGRLMLSIGINNQDERA